MIEAGRVGRPHGLDGSFYVTEPDPRMLAVGRELRVAGVSRRVERRAGTDARPIVRLAGLGTREGAQALRAAPLEVPLADAPALGEGEYWAHELEGATVMDGERLVGVVRRLVGLPSCEALEVVRPEGGELLVPLVRDAVREVDVAGRRIDVRLTFLGEA